MAESVVSLAPTLDREREFLNSGVRFLAALDEVGRGALAGPVSVGLVIIDLGALVELPSVRDSKLLKAQQRTDLYPVVQGWATACAVGHAQAHEIDQFGITDALALAAKRAYAAVVAAPQPAVADAVLLDGKHNWLSREPNLLDALLGNQGEADDVPGSELADLPVTMQIKADMSCQSVAAASILAKVERDAIMAELALEHPAFGWDVNKGYGTVGHREAIRQLGPSDYHRRSWKLL